MTAPRSDDMTPPGAPTFATTRWSLVIAAQGHSNTGRDALESLCRLYWRPVFMVVMERCRNPDTARDLTQEFFARLLARNGIGTVRPELGRFRSFLVRSVKNFLSDDWDKSRARKRGGGATILSIDMGDAEGQPIDIPHDITPDRLFDLEWARRLLRISRDRLREEFASAGRLGYWDILERVGEPGAPSLADEAVRIGIPLNTLKSHLRRARLRHAAILREVVADTVATPTEVDIELRHLLQVLDG